MREKRAVMPAEFNQWGIQFQYPENWTVDSESEPGGPHSVSVHSPDGAFWSVTTEGPDGPSLARHVVQAIQNEYEQCEFEPMVRRIGEHQVDGFELNFYCLDFLITAHVLNVHSTQGPLAVLYQAESRDFDRLQLVFDAISASLLQHRCLVE